MGLLPRLTECEQAQLRSQSGPLAGMTLSVAPSNVFTQIESPLFRVLHQRRLRFPSLSPHVSVGVAVLSTILATTELRARGRDS